MKSRFPLLTVLAAWLPATTPLPADEFVLVRDGASPAPIVVAEDVTPKNRRAADELADYIEKISGARPEILEGSPDPAPDRVIWIGYQPVLEELLPELDFDFEHPEEILIAANANHLVIAGRDRWDPEHLIVQGRNREIVGKQMEYGTANAVYTFLQDYLDVRWLWPGETGEDIIVRDTVAFKPFEYRYHPQFRQRGEIFRLSALGDSRGLSQDWCRVQRLKLDSLFVPGGHGFTTWWNRFHETNPEFFAMQPDGTRSGFPSPGNVKISVANPEVWQQWLADVESQLERDPTRTVFSAAFNDSAHRGHCVSPESLAWDHPDGTPRWMEWEGLAQEYVALTDRDVTFANHLGRLLKEKYPDQDYFVNIMAYGPTRPPPIEAVPDDNILIGNVANIFHNLDAVDSGCPLGTLAADQFAEWGKLAKQKIWRPNTGNIAGWQQGQPDFDCSAIAEVFRFAADHNCIGIYIDTVWEYWPNHAPAYYLMAQMAWNPYLDWEEVLDDYYQRGFGPAAVDVEAYWDLVQATRNRLIEEKLSHPEAFNQTFFDEANGLLANAAAKLEEAPEIYRDRLDFVGAGLEFNRLMVQTRGLMAEWLDGDETDDALADQMRANWEEMEKIARANLMNFSPMRPGSRYSARLHPDHR